MKIFKVFSLLVVGFGITPLLVSVSNKRPSVKPSISELEEIRRGEEKALNYPTEQTPSNIEPQPQREPCPCGKK
ncbi:hypothetical protein KKG61_02560 [bacterium]|nr:hypothetical protein [bacterium]MBU1598982.1 hypothetical protein [bacterium]MBU2462111.1 hypothetical protein [bacterium]